MKTEIKKDDLVTVSKYKDEPLRVVEVITYKDSKGSGYTVLELSHLNGDEINDTFHLREVERYEVEVKHNCFNGEETPLRFYLFGEQAKRQQEIGKIGLGLVTCAHCGSVIIHRFGEEKVICYDCFEEVHIEDCPDLFY